MVIMTVADDQRVHLPQIDFHKFQVVRVDIRRETEVEEVAPGFCALAGLDVQCQPPLAFQRLSLRRLGKSRAADRQTRKLRASQEDVVRAVSDFTDRKLVDYWRINPQRSGIRRTIEWYAASQQRATEDG